MEGTEPEGPVPVKLLSPCIGGASSCLGGKRNCQEEDPDAGECYKSLSVNY